MKARVVVLASVCLLLAGCSPTSSTMRVWGKANYQGQAIDEGQIVFIPVGDTRGPSTGGVIKAGQYDVPQAAGPRAAGTYRVEITALGPEQSYVPNASGVGLTAVVRKQLLPPQFNRESTLQMKISSTPADNQRDFDLE